MVDLAKLLCHCAEYYGIHHSECPVLAHVAATEARLAELEAERTGTVHESWQHKTHAELLEALKWQGAITKSLLAVDAEKEARLTEAVATLQAFSNYLGPLEYNRILAIGSTDSAPAAFCVNCGRTHVGAGDAVECQRVTSTVEPKS